MLSPERVSLIVPEFQSLTGRLQTWLKIGSQCANDPRFNPSQVGYKRNRFRANALTLLRFQSLTGRLQTERMENRGKIGFLFQSLTGRLQTLRGSLSVM